MATTYDYVNRSSGGADWHGEGTPVGVTDKTFVWKRRVDLAVAGDALTASGAFGNADVLQLFNVKAGTYVMNVVINVITAEGATLSVTIGDTDVDGYLVAGDLNATGWQSGNTIATLAADYLDGTTYQQGKFYTAADTIDMTLNTISADVAVFDIYIIGFNLSTDTGLL